ncbi:MAG: hypothetical protein NC084_08050 [Bacteroides sp.]|nr:hypothetical protein [Eubacterium sp.]MCM1418593.1 hypothetical protein [Roseburia sp.]MCM1462647.1 hypothetical protein [Bacteroides sp.]
MKKMKNVMNKMLAAAVIAASATTLFVPAYAEEAPVYGEEAYTVVEDEQGAVTIVFDEPIVLTRVDDDLADEAENDGIAPYATMSDDAIDKAYWGSYVSADDKYHVTITGATHISIRIFYPKYGECLCNGDNVERLYFAPTVTGSDNLTVNYTGYTKVNSTQNEFVNKPAEIIGRYHKGYAHPYFIINSITLNKA